MKTAMKSVSVKEFNYKNWKFLSIVFVPLLLIGLLSFQRTFRAQESLLYDFFLKLRPLQSISSNIAIIEIDDNTLNKLGQWPLPRDFHASLIDVLSELGAKAVIFDLIFSEPTDYDPVLAKSIKRSANVYLPEVYYFPQNYRASELLNDRMEILASITPELKQVISSVGHINIFIDSDGKVRKIPVFIKSNQGLIPQMGLQVACDYLKLNCKDVKWNANTITINGQLKIPVLDSNELLVNYSGQWKETFKHFSYLDILSKYNQYKMDQRLPKELFELKDKVCFVGLVATGTVDLKPSPLENNYPMMGVIANVFNSVVQGKFLNEALRPLQVWYVVLLYFVSIFVCLKLKPGQSLLSCFLLAVFCCVVTGVSLCVGGLWIDLFLPLLILLLVYVICTFLRWANERQKLELLEKEMAIAQKIQMQFLQGPQQESCDLDVALWLEPAKYVAGDFYDLFKIDEYRSGIFIGDVSGKGLPAALCMAQAISLFRIFSRLESSLDQTLNRLNQELCLRNIDRFVTAMYCVADAKNNTVTVASAGHGSLYIYRHENKSILELKLPVAVPLGVMQDSQYSSDLFNLDHKDKYILLSDGIYEARNAQGEEIGIEKIKEHFLANATKSNQEILESFKVMLMAYGNGENLHDDMTLIIFSFKPQS